MIQDVSTQVSVDEDAILEQQLATRKAKWDGERIVVLRVYNYFRIILSFFLLILFYQVPDQRFVGSLAPDWFQSVLLFYLMANVAAGFAILVRSDGILTNATAISSIVILDIFFLSVLLYTSGGVDSGLGYLLVFSVAFGSVMLSGQYTLLFPSIATVNSISCQLYLNNSGATDGSQQFFQVAMLGTAYFVVNLFFQYVSRRIEEREMEVVSLETLDRLHRIAEQSRQELEISNARFTVLLSSTGEGVLGIDLDGTVSFANPRACQLLDIEYDDLIGSDIQRFMIAENQSGDDKVVSLRPQKILELLDIQPRFSYDPLHWQTAQGETFIIDYSSEATVSKRNEPTGAVLLFQNVTQQRENEQRLQYLASHDALTGLPNRANFNEVLKNAISRTRRTDRSIAILIVDSDHFTVFNERLGQEAGDEMLRILSTRLKEGVRDGDFVARLHGDQFAVMLVDLDHVENAAVVADKLINICAAPMRINNEEQATSVSIGIAVMNEERGDADELISAGNSAVELAKSEGRNTYRFHQPDIQSKAEEKKRIQIMLRGAIEQEEFQLMYQPIISIKDESIHSAEALIRWFPKDADPIRPDIFIPISEESGQINQIGSWVLSSVCQQIRTWKENLGANPSIAINISSRQLRDSVFREQFENSLTEYSIPIEDVELELTETGVMEDPEKCLEELGFLHQLGVSISIDDFGTGYSSLDYLRRLPLDILKIDQSFTRGIGVSENDEEIVRVMIRMAHAMGLKVICEGVETREQLNFLRAQDCDLVQGYYFSKPRSVMDMTQLYRGELDGSIQIMEGAAGY